MSMSGLGAALLGNRGSGVAPVVASNDGEGSGAETKPASAAKGMFGKLAAKAGGD
jgi:hypothetical protein